jgi:signal transduction histidine kinase
MTGDNPIPTGAASPEEILGRLTRGALHELANPLLALLGTAEFALEDAEPGTKLHDRLSLGAAAEETVVLLRRVTALRDVEMVAEAAAPAEVVAAPGEVKRRLVELVLAGLETAERGETVRLSVRAEGGEAVAEVAGAGALRLPLAGAA